MKAQTTGPGVVRVPRDVYEEMCAHARAEFPNECCGMLVRRSGGKVEAVRVTNIQDRKHAEDPQRYPRTARTAYTMGPEAVPVLLAHDRGELEIAAFYHSHPQHDAYFSAEDRAQATVWGEPSYPDAGQIVISVYDGEVRDARAFCWDPQVGDFVPADLLIDDSGRR